MSTLSISGSGVGTALTELLMSDDIQPGDETSYQLCKLIYLYHPLGAKMAESPIAMAQSQDRIITVQGSPEDAVRDAFSASWKALDCDRIIFAAAVLSRIYGVGSIIAVAKDFDPMKPLPLQDPSKLAALNLSFNILDPINTSGSFSLVQDPNSPDFQQHSAVKVSGIDYHPSRAVIVLNEQSIYISYSSSSFGYVGRSVYQRPLFALKSFIQSMITDDLVTRKAGLLVAKLKQPGSIVSGVMSAVMGVKRQLLKDAQTNQVISISSDEDIHAIDLTNVDAAHSAARKHILENTAAAASMPAQLLNNETFAEGFGEGSEDAKAVARYIDRERIKLNPTYRFFDRIVQACAWTPEFYETIQANFPEQYAKVPFKQAFYSWVNSFKATWPSLLTEPDSEKIKVEDIKFKAIIALIEALKPGLDPENTTKLLAWASDNLNENKLLFPTPLVLDLETLEEFIAEQTKKQEDMQQPGAGGLEASPGSQNVEPKPRVGAG